MKSQAVILLSFGMMVHLALKFSPIPYLAIAVSLMAFPLAVSIPWRQLFIIELVTYVFSMAISPDQIIGQFWLGYDMMLTYGLPQFVTLYVVLFCLILPGMILLAAALSASLMKLLSRFIPKRFKHLG